VKAMMQRCRITEPPKGMREGAYYAHFPKLNALLGDAIQGRASSKLQQFARADFLSNWSIDSRYWPKICFGTDNGGVNDRQYDRWKADAEQALSALEEL
jgi:hypothetical protein